MKKLFGTFIFITILSFAISNAASAAVETSERPTICTMEYRPVCGQKDTGIRCVTTPCDSHEKITYGNMCGLQADGAEFLYEGECVNNVSEERENLNEGQEEITDGEMLFLPEGSIIPPPWHNKASVRTETTIQNHKEGWWDAFIYSLKDIIIFWK